jgi:hypothetical protein
MTIEELRLKLDGLVETRQQAEAQLLVLKGSRERAEQLERDRDALLESMAEAVPSALEELTGEGRNKVYRMLRLQVTPTANGYEVTGALTGFLHNGTATFQGHRGQRPPALRAAEQLSLERHESSTGAPRTVMPVSMMARYATRRGVAVLLRQTAVLWTSYGKASITSRRARADLRGEERWEDWP